MMQTELNRSAKEITFPRPKPDMKEYDEIVRRGLERNHVRQSNYLKYTKRKYDATIQYLPIKMDFENVSRCNLRCEMCQMTKFNNGRRASDLSYADFKNILDEMEGLIEIKIQGMGEPFLGKDFTRMVNYAYQKDIWIRSTTNGTLLDKNENYKKIIDAGISEIQVSVDGATAATYEKIRKNANFQKVVKNCEMINKYCRDMGMHKTRMWVLLQHDNFHELDKFPTFAKELGFTRLSVSMDVNGWGDEEKTGENKEKNVSHKMSQDDIDRLLVQADRLGIDLSFWDITTKFNRKNPCPWPFERAYISSDKKVVPCCMIGNPDTYNFGSLGNFEDIWRSEKYNQFRDAHRSGNIPDVCKFCYEGGTE